MSIPAIAPSDLRRLPPVRLANCLWPRYQNWRCRQRRNGVGGDFATDTRIGLDALHRIRKLVLQRSDAVVAGKLAAAEQLHRQLLESHDTLYDAVRGIGDGLRIAHVRQQQLGEVKLRTLANSLMGIAERFTGAVFCRQYVEVSTDQIVLSEENGDNEVALGRFEIRLRLETLGAAVEPTSRFLITACSPNPPPGKEEIPHPHVYRHAVCMGDNAVAIEKAVQDGRLLDAFLMVDGILHTYHDGSCYEHLANWFKEEEEEEEEARPTCRRCDDGDADDWCSQCEVDICNSCSSQCHECGTYGCSECINNRCQQCRRYFCDRCSASCDACGEVFCNLHINSGHVEHLCDDCGGECGNCQEMYPLEQLVDGNCEACRENAANDDNTTHPMRSTDESDSGLIQSAITEIRQPDSRGGDAAVAAITDSATSRAAAGAAALAAAITDSATRRAAAAGCPDRDKDDAGDGTDGPAQRLPVPQRLADMAAAE